jgi:hypothetical protein
MKNFDTSDNRSRFSSIVLALAGLFAALTAFGASASVALPELHGVAEQLGAHRLAVDGDELWALVLLIAVVVTLWIFHRKDRGK